jgi:hypothetical protein
MSNYTRDTKSRAFKALTLRKHPRSRSSQTIPVLNYNSGSVQSTIRSFLGFATLAPQSITDVSLGFPILPSDLVQFNNMSQLFLQLYTNIRVTRITFRVVPFRGSFASGVHALAAIPGSVDPEIGPYQFTDLVSFPVSHCCKIYQPFSVQWVPSMPSELNFKSMTDPLCSFLYGYSLATSIPEDTKLAAIFIDSDVQFRTINSVTPANFQLFKDSLNLVQRRQNEKLGDAILASDILLNKYLVTPRDDISHLSSADQSAIEDPKQEFTSKVEALI